MDGWRMKLRLRLRDQTQTADSRTRLCYIKPHNRFIKIHALTDVFFYLFQGIFAGTKVKALNVTADDDDLDEINFEQFKNTIRRYRRLIPYMSYYVANNYVNQNGQFVEPVLRKPARQRTEPTRKPIRTPAKDHQTKFIPSVQFNPKDIGGDTNYFMPVRYNAKLNYEDPSYQEYNRRPYVEITTPSPIAETRYYKERPRPYNLVLPQSSQLKQTRRPDSYLFDYVRPKPTTVNSEYYPVDYEPIRYVKVEPTYQLGPVPQHHHQHQHQHQLQHQQKHQLSHVLPTKVPTNRPIYISRNTGELNEENLIKSLQLTNQLPEMLNRDNIDSSIKTLVEILALLHGAKKELNIGDNSSVQKLSVQPSVPVPVPDPSPAVYEEYKPHKPQYSRPKVVTEMRYQATSPAPIAGESLRFTATPPPASGSPVQNNGKPNILYDRNNAKPQPTEYSDYPSAEVQLKNKNIVEYYTPLIQDIDENTSPSYMPNKLKHKESVYKIVEELEDVNQEINSPVTPPKNYLDGIAVVMNPKPGVTTGKPGVDYPTYTDIPVTDFSCKDQRYKGFFGDPATRCQCESTTQLYVLNERLYKFILPIMPKFPEDFSGPEVDRYLELKFKEMEAKLKAKKLKKAMEKKEKEKPQTPEPELEQESAPELE
ncbi:Protein of unknown function [Cotesia congregata]|uniref:Uncharacterized protein n=1 Tax=Cotesia congregata TaxID=51543 RepID=A0A8J2H9Y4_COTCN|nr:Protein of unknown function [Cotesia congregata]